MNSLLTNHIKDPTFILHAKNGLLMARSYGDLILSYNGINEVSINLDFVFKHSKTDLHFIHAINEVFNTSKMRSFVFGCYSGLLKYKKYHANQLNSYISSEGWLLYNNNSYDPLKKDKSYNYVTITLPAL